MLVANWSVSAMSAVDDDSSAYITPPLKYALLLTNVAVTFWRQTGETERRSTWYLLSSSEGKIEHIPFTLCGEQKVFVWNYKPSVVSHCTCSSIDQVSMILDNYGMLPPKSESPQKYKKFRTHPGEEVNDLHRLMHTIDHKQVIISEKRVDQLQHQNRTPISSLRDSEFLGVFASRQM